MEIFLILLAFTLSFIGGSALGLYLSSLDEKKRRAESDQRNAGIYHTKDFNK